MVERVIDKQVQDMLAGNTLEQPMPEDAATEQAAALESEQRATAEPGPGARMESPAAQRPAEAKPPAGMASCYRPRFSCVRPRRAGPGTGQPRVELRHCPH